MRVDPNSNASAISAPQGQTAAPGPRLGQDKIALTATDSLNHSLEQTPDVRADKVSQAKTMIQDDSYPPELVIRQISALLANNLEKKANSDEPTPSGS